MGSHESDEYMSNCEFNHYYQAIFISLDVEYVMLVTNVVSSREIYFYIRQVLPLCFFSYVIPAFESCLRVSMPFRTVELN